MPRSAGALRANIEIGDPLSSTFEQQAMARAGGPAPSPVCPGDQASSIGNIVDLVPWALLTSPKRETSETEVEVVIEEHRQQVGTVP